MHRQCNLTVVLSQPDGRHYSQDLLADRPGGGTKDYRKGFDHFFNEFSGLPDIISGLEKLITFGRKPILMAGIDSYNVSALFKYRMMQVKNEGKK